MPSPPPPSVSPATLDKTIGLPAGPDLAGRASIYDLATLVELEGVFGRARLMELLAHLKEEIARRLPAPVVNRTVLRNDAHVLLSVSGSLGFFELSRRCIEIEEACRLGADLDGPLRAVRAAANGAIAAIEDLVAPAVEARPAIRAA